MLDLELGIETFADQNEISLCNPNKRPRYTYLVVQPN